MRARYLIPLAVFLILAAFLAVGLKRNPREVPSPFIGKPAPAFSLAQLHQPQQVFSNQDLQGKVSLLNVWASWCVSCRDEHPLLVEFSKSGLAPVYGLNYKDQRGNALKWLQEWGNPYTLSVSDLEGRVGIDYGVYGVPETFVIDKQGVIQYKQIGPLTPQVLEEKIVPLIKRLQQG